jgi:hypothetical protein
MVYTFRTNQLHIFNVLFFDSSISLQSIETLKLVDNYVEFEVERRAFENVTREKKLFGHSTNLKGVTSTIRIENVSELSVSGLTEQFMCNHFFVDAETDSKGEINIESVFGLKINLRPKGDFIIKLSDIKDSDFGNGTLGGICGYTKEEWRHYLVKEKYINPSDDTV